MRLSQNFTKTLKNAPSDEVSKNAQLLIRAGFVDKTTAWVYSFLPMWYKLLKNIQKIVEDEMKKLWAQYLHMPALTPKKNWEETGRWDNIDVLFKFQAYYSKKEYAFAPTHEEVIVPLVQNYINSYKDLPFGAFQIQNKFRDELRAKSGLLRGREFLMKDLYSFHEDIEDLENYYQKAIQAYKNVYNDLWIWKQTYITYADWWTFSKYSHEFQTVTEAGEDYVHICERCDIAINEEIIDQQDTCPECGNSDLKKTKAAEVGNIFKLKDKFSKPFDLTYQSENGKQKHVQMWCYGIGISRLMWVLVETFHDDKWMKLPEDLSPYNYCIIPIGWKETQNKASKLYKFLKEEDKSVVLDDREDKSPWYKLKDADLIGYPYKIVVSDKTIEKWEDIIEITTRKDGETKFIDYKSIT